MKLPVAAVINAANNGSIFVRWATGSRLADLHDVEANGSKQDGNVLAWNAANNRWQPIAPSGDLDVIIELPYIVAKNITIDSSKNGLSVGPVEVQATYAVTVPQNSSWAVV